MRKWYKPIVKTYYVSDLVKEVKARASSYEPVDPGLTFPDLGGIVDGIIGSGGGGGEGEWWCPVQVCTYGIMCDNLQIL